MNRVRDVQCQAPCTQTPSLGFRHVLLVVMSLVSRGAPFFAASERETVLFEVLQTAAPNESVFVVGDVSELGGGDLRKSIGLIEVEEGLWQVRVALPPDCTYTYQYFLRDDAMPPPPGRLCDLSNATPLGPPTTERTAPAPQRRDRLLVYRSNMQSPVLWHREPGRWFRRIEMRRVGMGRAEAESTWLASGFARVSGTVSFYVEDAKTERRDPIEGTYTSSLPAALLQDGGLFDYVPQGVVSPPRFDYERANPPTINSVHLGERRHYRVLLPRGYDEHTRLRYPVLYLHDGTVVFDGLRRPGRVTAPMDPGGKLLASLMASGSMREAIVVAVDEVALESLSLELSSTEFQDIYFRLRTRSLFPQGHTALDEPGHAETYRAFLVDELKPFIDATYRTLTGPQDTVTAGGSAGGLVSVWLGWTLPEIFGNVGSWSGSLFIEGVTCTEELGVAASFTAQMLEEPNRAIRIYLDSGDVDPQFGCSYDNYEVNRIVRDNLVSRSTPYVVEDDLRYVYACRAPHTYAEFAKRWPETFSFLLRPDPSANEVFLDCNANGFSDAQEIAANPTFDLDADGTLDLCEPDCNDNANPDDQDIAQKSSQDCDQNGVPDECDADCNENAVPDACDLVSGNSTDCNANETPDECEVALQRTEGCAVFHAAAVPSSPVTFDPRMGTTQSSAGCLEIVGVNGNISLRRDSFHFAHQTVFGNFRLTARIAEWTTESSSSKLGLMVREGLEEDARHGAVILEGRSFRHRFLTRESVGESTTSRRHDAYEEPTVWLRIERQGSTVSGQLSPDGLTWTAPDEVELVGLSEQVHVGVASSYRGSSDDPSFTRICELTLEPLDGKPTPHFIRGDCDGDGNPCSGVNDALELLSWLFLGRAAPPCRAACDADGNNELELADAVYGLNFCFKGFGAPAAPFPGCGRGTEADAALGCERSSCE